MIPELETNNCGPPREMGRLRLDALSVSKDGSSSQEFSPPTWRNSGIDVGAHAQVSIQFAP
jgi:hypothetical protein